MCVTHKRKYGEQAFAFFRLHVRQGTVAWKDLHWTCLATCLIGESLSDQNLMSLIGRYILDTFRADVTVIEMHLVQAAWTGLPSYDAWTLDRSEKWRPGQSTSWLGNHLPNLARVPIIARLIFSLLEQVGHLKIFRLLSCFPGHSTCESLSKTK